MRFKTSDGVRLEYDDSGQGPVVMILSGIGGSRVIWRDQVSALVDAGYRVINIDARNQGASEHTKKVCGSQGMRWICVRSAKL